MLSLLIPSFGPRTLLAVIGIVLVASLGGSTFLAGVLMQRSKTIALDLEWRLKLEKANHEAEQEANRRAQEAADAALQVTPAGPTDDDLERLCDSDEACRDQRKPG